MDHLKITELRNQLSVRCKNGIPFLLGAAVIWCAVTVIFQLDLEIKEKNIFMLYTTGMMFPLAVLTAKIIKADWKTNDHPLGILGLMINFAQIVYFPFLVWSFSKNPEAMVMFFAMITGAHFFPYGWLYNTKAYYVMAPAISVGALAVGWNGSAETLWFVPLFMVAALLFLAAWLFKDYRQKTRSLPVTDTDRTRAIL